MIKYLRTFINKLFSIKYVNDYVNSYIFIYLLGFKIKIKYYVCKRYGKINSNPLVFINYLAVKNIGDKYSSPTNYFKFDNYIKYDYLYTIEKNITQNKNIIIGGGVYCSQYINSIRKKNLIGWGIGFFKEDHIDASLFKLLGTREYNFDLIDNKKIFYVPCVSCLHPIFDKKFTIKHKFVFYLHKQKTLVTDLKKIINYPYITNEDNFYKVIKFIGSSEYVITNSYHGVYWATLLNKKVLCIPYNSKFYGYKYPPVYATFENWKEKINETKNYPEALNDCRQINLDFYQKVCEVING